jgi:hypothetical protein
VRVDVALTKLDAYVDKEIPDHVLSAVMNARELGAETFHVATPTIRSADPVVVAELDGNLVFIAEWGK